MSEPTGVRPARPHTATLDDGRRLAVLTTYTRRGSRLTPSQQKAWDAHAGEWLIPDAAVDDPSFSLARWFGRDATLVVEIGCGVGEATAALAATRPECNVLGFEVWQPGVADTFGRLEKQGAGNVRMIGVDAVWSFEHLLGPGSVRELWTFFPDPWPKKKHHKRRLVSPGFVRTATSRLEPGGVWRLATDWPEYAEQMAEVLAAEPGLTGGRVERWDERPLTRFERRGLAEGRPVADFEFRRI